MHTGKAGDGGKEEVDEKERYMDWERLVYGRQTYAIGVEGAN